VNFFYTRHVLQRMFDRSISEYEIEYAVLFGVSIKEYPDDKPYPSVLVFNGDQDNPLHVVYSNVDIDYYIITAYRPDVNEWHSDNITRREP